ncbi:MAG: hypothetical protein J5666_04320, partial [Bacilli bacterium]|nr:hypothetical protein [Bacilli bacterium]
MNKLSRLLFATIMFLGISLSSCNSGNKSWNYTDEELKNAIELETIVQLDEKLRISISSEDNFFKRNISKDAILVAPKINEGEGEDITFKELKKARIEDFTFKQIDRKNVIVTLEEYSSPAYYVYFDKSTSTENKVALATISLYIDTKGGDPIFALDERTNYLGASNPDFVIHYSNATTDKAEPSYVELSDAFKDLQIKSVVPSKNIITIHTTGTISQALKGTITLKEGFFNDVKKDVSVVSDIIYSVACIDQASYKLEDNKLSFDIRSISLDFEPGINSSQLSINIEQNLASIDKVTYKNENTINVSLSLKDTYTSINDALSDINNSEIVFNDVFKGIDGVFSFKINVQFPAISIYPQLFKRENRLIFTVYLRHAKEVELVKEDITLYDSNIILEGDSKNAEIEQFESLTDGFTMSIKLNDGFGDDAYGYIRINLDKVITKWNTIYSVFEKFDSETVISTNWTKKEMETYKMNVLSYSSGPFVHKFLMSAGYTASAFASVIAKGVKGTDGAISSVLSIFNLWGFTSYAEPTCADVLNKLVQVEQEVYSATQKLNSFSESMEKELSYLRYGIDNIAYEQYKAEWTKFNKDYVEAMDDIIRTNKNKYFKEFVDAIKAVDEYLDIRVYYHVKDGEYVYTLADPNDPYMSVEGLEIKKSHRIRIPVSYLQPLLDEINTNGGYTSKVPTIFEACVKSFLADNEHIASRVPFEAIKGTFDLMLEMKTITKEDALEFNNIFMNYANQIAGNNGTGISALSSYYKMMEGMYNFQSETKDVFKDFRTDQKNDFDDYANYNNTKRVLAGIEINLDEFNEAYE